MNRIICLSWFAIATTLSLFAQLDAKPMIEGVGVDEHLGQTLDLSLSFRDRKGKTVTLAEILDGELPTIFIPAYYTCPMLCSAILSGTRDMVNDINLRLGLDYRIVTVSFDPENSHEVAAAKAENYYATLADRRAADQWYFLTGDEPNIRLLMDELGFRYKKIEDLYSHVAVLVMVSPEGKITRYLHGVRFDSRTARLALIESSGGKVGSTVERFLIYCFKFDPLQGKYTPYAWGVMRIGSAASGIMLVFLVIILVRAELMRKRRLGQNV